MFGYILPYIPELKVKEYDAYKSVYCGLCHQLGRSFSSWVRLTLNYDFTFLAMLYYASKDSSIEITKKRCSVNPLVKVNTCGPNDALEYTADAGMLMMYYKVMDNITDAPIYLKPLWKCASLAISGYKKKAAKRQPALDKIFRDMLRAQADVEKNKSHSVDEAAEPTALAIAAVVNDIGMGADMVKLGYLIGRYIYLCDALDDIKTDEKNKDYNPFVLKYGSNSKALEYGKQTLFMTVAEIARISKDMQFNCFDPIIHNILELGIYHSVLNIYKKGSGAIDGPV